MTNEERLRYAKENYHEGMIVECIYDGSREIVSEPEKFFIDEDNDIWTNNNLCLYSGVKNEWAAIILKPETNTKKITHEEAIKTLEGLYALEFSGSKKSKRSSKCLEYAINQLKQCEVFDEPVEMEVSVSETFSKKCISTRNEIVYGKWNGQYICKDKGKMIYLMPYARPIKKDPLLFTEWVELNINISRNKDGNGLWKDSVLDDYVKEYQLYLNQFKNK